jgi:hypothetical protein
MAQAVKFSISIRKKSSSILSRDNVCPEKYFTIDHDHIQNLYNSCPLTNYPTIRHYMVCKAVRRPLNNS